MLRKLLNYILKTLLGNERGETSAEVTAENDGRIPDEVLMSLAESFLPYIRKYLMSEEGQREYAKWERERAARNNEKRQTEN